MYKRKEIFTHLDCGSGCDIIWFENHKNNLVNSHYEILGHTNVPQIKFKKYKSHQNSFKINKTNTFLTRLSILSALI